MTVSTLVAKELAATVEAVETAKPAKASKAKAKPAPKAAAKPAPKAVKATSAKPAQKKAAKAKYVPAAFGLAPSYRPSAGKALQCHTQAVLEFFGLTSKNGAAMKSDIRKVMGDTAVAYHLGQTVANFTESEGVIRLTPRGKEVFATRASAMDEAAQALVATYVGIFKTGKPDGKVVKNATGINKFAA